MSDELDFWELAEQAGLPLGLARGGGEKALHKLVAAREVAANAAEHADNMYRIYAESQEILLLVAEARLAGETPLGQRMMRDSEFYLGTARGMPTSEARKRQEERGPAPEGEPLRVGYGHHPASICVRCGIPGGNAQICWPKGEPVCCSAEDCGARVALAEACLKPVTQA